MQRTANGDYSMSRKSLNQIVEGLSQSHINDINTNSEGFRNAYQRAVLSHLSNNCKNRELIRIVRCKAVTNRELEARFFNFQRSLESQGVCADVSFGFVLLSDSIRELELIAQYGLSVNNNFVGDLGDPIYGVYLSEHPDLVTPAPFLGRTRVRILACKILKGRCNTVGLGSYRLIPTQGYNSHAAAQPVDRKLTRHDNYRYDQIFLFEEKGNAYAKSPANILPYAAYDMEFPSNTTLPFKLTDSTVWTGTVVVGNKRYPRISLHSSASATKPPLLDVFEVTDLIHWTACMAFPPIIELLKPPALGELAVKKEVLLAESRRLVYYFTLVSDDRSHDFVALHESMRIRRAAGITIFPATGILILLPNGLFSDLLALPMIAGSVFQCLYLTADTCSSLVRGTFEMVTTEENDEFTRPLLLQERVDGLDARVQELVRNAAPLSQEHSEKMKMLKEVSEPVDMDIAEDSDDNEEKRGWRDDRTDVTSEVKQLSKGLDNQVAASNSNVKPTSPLSVNEAVSEAARLLSSDPRREKALVSRDPRKRQGLMSSHILPIPSCGVVKRAVPSWSTSTESTEVEKKPITSPSDVPRSYSPSDAISSGSSSPKTSLQSQKSPCEESPNLAVSDSPLTLANFIKNDSELDEVESPASPPRESGVFVATAPKIISDSDMRSLPDSTFQTSARQYRPPEVTPFTALASMEAMKKSGQLEKQQQDKKIDDGGKGDTTSASRDNEIPMETYILPELLSFSFNKSQTTSAESEKKTRSHSRWDVLPSTSAVEQNSSWKKEIEKVGIGDVDMRTMYPATSASKISHEAISPTASSVVHAVQAPIVFSNGDTDHRITSAAVRPSTSAQPPFVPPPQIRPLPSFAPVSSMQLPPYSSSSSTSHVGGFEKPLVYGFFNQPTVAHPPKPYFQNTSERGSFPLNLSRRGILMIDDAQFTNGTLDPGMFRMVLERFSKWRRSSSILWWVKLHKHSKETLAFAANVSSSDPKLAERYAQYENIITEYENLKVVHTMESHECDDQKDDMNTLLKCLGHIANANRKCDAIYLTDIPVDSPVGKQIANEGFEICCCTSLLTKLGI